VGSEKFDSVESAGGLIAMVRNWWQTYSQKAEIVPSDLFTPESIPPFMNHLYSLTCKSFILSSQGGKPSPASLKKAEMFCSLVRKSDPEDIWAMVSEGERLLVEEKWEEASRILTGAFERDRGNANLRERAGRAQKLLKVSKQIDYYKILGVTRDADKQTIKKAYRKASLKAHPDKGGSEDKMAEVNRAYEVLSNDEHKARYDAGEDPMDPTANQQGPFQQGPGFGGMPQQMFHQFFQQGQHGGGSQQQFNFRWG